eukprot:889740_1
MQQSQAMMTAHNFQEKNDVITAGNMVFDELFQNDLSMMNNTAAATQCAARYNSVPYDEEQADVPAVVPISPCSSRESSASSATSVTGKLSNIEYKYHVDPRVLGSGHHGSVRECIDRSTGQRYAVKSIRKRDPAVRLGGLAREIILLQEMNHESIIQLVDVYEDDEYVHLVTDLC